MSKDSRVLVQNETRQLIRAVDRVTGQRVSIPSGDTATFTGNRGSEDDLLIYIENPKLPSSASQTVGKFRFENPDVGYSWMKSDWGNRTAYLRGQGKVSHPYYGLDYVVQATRDQKVTTGKLAKGFGITYGKANPNYDPQPVEKESVWGFASSEFSPDQYLLTKGFRVNAGEVLDGHMTWGLKVLDVNWAQLAA